MRTLRGSITWLEPRRESTLGADTVLFPCIRFPIPSVVAAARRQGMRTCMRRNNIIGLEVVGRDALSIVLVGSGGPWVEEVVYTLEGSSALAT